VEKAKVAKTKTAGIAERLDTCREIVGRKMRRWKSTAKAKEKAKAMEKVRMQDTARVHGNPREHKGHGKGYGKKGLYWFDQPSEPSSQYDPAWAFSVSEKPKAKVNERKPRGPPGLAPPILTSTSNKYEHLTPDDENDSDGDDVVANKCNHRIFTIGDAISIAKKKKGKAAPHSDSTNQDEHQFTFACANIRGCERPGCERPSPHSDSTNQD